jgi:hypothetical protein
MPQIHLTTDRVHYIQFTPEGKWHIYFEAMRYTGCGQVCSQTVGATETRVVAIEQICQRCLRHAQTTYHGEMPPTRHEESA